MKRIICICAVPSLVLGGCSSHQVDNPGDSGSPVDARADVRPDGSVQDSSADTVQESSAPSDAANDSSDAADGAVPYIQIPAIIDHGWAWENPRPQGNTLQAMYAATANNVWFAGDLTTLLNYDGHTLTQADYPGRVSASINTISGCGASDIWTTDTALNLVHYDGHSWAIVSEVRPAQAVACVPNSGVWVASNKDAYHYDGNVWTKYTVPGGYYIQAVWGDTANNVYLGGLNGNITHWNGSTMTTSVAGSGTLDFQTIFGHGQYVWAGGSSQSEQDMDMIRPGGSWEAEGLNGIDVYSITGIWGSSIYDMYAVGPTGLPGQGVIYRGGALWTNIIDEALTGNYLTIGGTFVDNMWVAGDWGEMVHMQSDGWARAATDLFGGNGVSSVWGVSSSDVWAIGQYFMHYDGQKWAAESNVPADFSGSVIWASSTSDIWMGGNNTEAWTDLAVARWNGTEWNVTDLGVQAQPRSIWGTGTGEVWYVGDTSTGSSVVMRWDGTHWTQAAEIQSGGAVSISGSGPHDVWVGMAVGGLWHWDGSEFKQVLDGLDSDSGLVGNDLRSVWAADSTHAWAVAGDHGLSSEVLEWNGFSWTKVAADTSGVVLNAVFGTSPSDVWVMGMGTGMHYDGSQWTTMNIRMPVDSMWASADGHYWGVSNHAIVHKKP